MLTCYDREFSPKKSCYWKDKTLHDVDTWTLFSIKSKTNDTKVLRPHSLAFWRHCYENKNVNVWSVLCESHGEKLESENVKWRAVGCGGNFEVEFMQSCGSKMWLLTRPETVRCKPWRHVTEPSWTADRWWLWFIMDNYLITRHVFSSSSFHDRENFSVNIFSEWLVWLWSLFIVDFVFPASRVTPKKKVLFVISRNSR